MIEPRKIGVLALQGAFHLHSEVLQRLGLKSQLVRIANDLQKIDGLIIPGGELTTMRWLLKAEKMVDSFTAFSKAYPVMGTCAGMLLLARQVTNDPVGSGFGVIDIDVRRNAYGRQVHSHCQDGEIDLGDGRRKFPMVYIRAPRIERVGREVCVLGWRGEEPTMVRQGKILAMSFHPELSDSDDIHRYFIEQMVLPTPTGRKSNVNRMAGS